MRVADLASHDASAYTALQSRTAVGVALFVEGQPLPRAGSHYSTSIGFLHSAVSRHRLNQSSYVTHTVHHVYSNSSPYN